MLRAHESQVKPMKEYLIAMFVLAAAPLAFATSDICEVNCCMSNGGDWDYDYESCDGASSGYYSCINQCEGMAGASASCCGPAALLLAVLGGVAAFRRQ